MSGEELAVGREGLAVGGEELAVGGEGLAVGGEHGARVNRRTEELAVGEEE